MTSFLRTLCTLLALTCATVSQAGEVILTVTGDVADGQGAQSWTFDRAALEQLPQTTITTSTIWTEGVHSYSGVSLHALLSHVGAQSGTLQAVALNDYAVTIPTSDAVADGPIVAHLRDGAPMSVRDKGPLWIIYPYDANQAYQSEEIYARSIWQLDRLNVSAE